MAATRRRSTLDAARRSRRATGKLILVTAINPTPGGRRQDDDLGRPRRRAQPDRQARRCWRCANRRSARASAPRAARPAAAMRRSCRWRTSTSISPAISTRSPAAHNLLAAMIDNHIHWGNALDIDVRRDRLAARARHERPRAARHRPVARRRRPTAIPRESGFDITVASEVMAILCLAERPGRPGGAARPDRRRLHARPPAGHRARPEGGRRDGGAAGGGDQAQPRPDAGGQSRRSSTAGRSPTSRMAATR